MSGAKLQGQWWVDQGASRTITIWSRQQEYEIMYFSYYFVFEVVFSCGVNLHVAAEFSNTKKDEGIKPNG